MIPYDSAATTKGGRFLGLAAAFLAVAVHFTALRAVGAYMGGEPSTLFAVFILPAVITLWILPPARRHGLIRWPVLWLLFYTSTVPVAVLIVGETWVLHRFFVREFPGQHKWAKDDSAATVTDEVHDSKAAAKKSRSKP